jgi:hypothetical protein
VYLKLIERDGSGFQVVEARTVLFRRHPEPVAICDVDTPTAKTYPLTANAYLLNERGQTIETFMFKANGDRKT